MSNRKKHDRQYIQQIMDQPMSMNSTDSRSQFSQIYFNIDEILFYPKFYIIERFKNLKISKNHLIIEEAIVLENHFLLIQEKMMLWLQKYL